MKSKYIIFALLLAVATSFVSCDEDGWLQRDPKDRITDEQLWNDAACGCIQYRNQHGVR